MLDMKMAIEPPQKYNSQISQKVNDAILKGMELDYQSRPQSITEWFKFLGIQTNKKPNPPNPPSLQEKGDIKASLLVGERFLTNLKTFTFEVVTTNAKGSIIKKRNHSANYFVEDLGNGVKLEMVEIPAGTFYMGSPTYETGRSDDEGPQHQVNVPSFFIGKYPLTQAQYQAIMGNNPAHFKGNNRPVECVSWNNAVNFCQKLSQKTGKNYKLPSEAQWEYACRAGTTTPFYFGESITSDLVNYHGNYAYAAAPKGQYREQTTDVGTFPPNAFGLYDMHGNVYEWCEDDWNENYISAPINGSALISQSDKNTLRGGSWCFDPEDCRSACRGSYRLVSDYNAFGFRVVCSGAART